MGKTRTFSPTEMRPFNISNNSGLWRLASHWPKSSRTENMRSFARAFSSSRLAPPMQASNLNSSIVSSKVTVCNTFLEAYFPLSSLALPWSMESWTYRTISSAPVSLANQSLNSIVSGKLCPVSM